MLAKFNELLDKIWLTVASFLLFGTSVILLTSCVINPQDINWQKTPLTGTILGTYERGVSKIGNPTIYVRIKIEDSGEEISIRDTGEIPVIIRGKKLILNRGITKEGKKFYRLVRLEEK
jgi:hypothetical protein